ncbi:MAG: PQQ-dependent sugar dehydrogenase, partial [Planctomycetes bacterium]|nr:PQQ-dependent sugar dehydrogenase [Planctomycetota bacterium]
MACFCRVKLLNRMALMSLMALLFPVGTAIGDTPLETIRVASGLNRPVFATAAPGDSNRLFIMEQRGVIKILELDTNTVLGTPFLDIDALVLGPIDRFDERGLLGLVFHPDWANNGFFFVNYVSNSRFTTIARYKISDGDPNVADPASAEIVLQFFQPFSNHNAGWIDFGPNDGHLYISAGDGGSANDPGNRAQDITDQFLGKLLRINVDSLPYSIPADNPFVGKTGDDEIWAYGLRNPWRPSFDRDTGDLYIADVGQNAREEINFQPADSTGGENYGWRCMEGNRCTGLSGCVCFSEDLVDPIHEYIHPIGFSVTGGYVYRGAAIPDLSGVYFFADYETDRIWSFRFVLGQVTEFTERTAELANEFFINDIASFGEDNAGEMYIVDRGSTTTGQIFKIIPSEPICIVHGDPNWDRDDPNTWTSFEDWAFSGYVDPKVESTDGENHNLGIIEITVVFNTEPFGGPNGEDVTPLNVTVEVTGGTPPTVINVSKNGNALTVEFDPETLPPLQEWTTLDFDVFDDDGIEIVDSGNEGEGVDECARLDVATLPSDVNNDGSTQPLDLSREIASFGAGDPFTMLP